MNDKNGTSLSVGQRVQLSHVHGNAQKVIATYVGTVEALYPAGALHPRGGGAKLEHGKAFPGLADAPAHVAARADYVDGGKILPGKSSVDLVVVQLLGADRAQHMPDHDLAEPCASAHLRAHESPACSCPVRGWWPADSVEVVP